MPAFFTEGFSVREPMWHGLGAILDDYPSWDEAYVLAGHDFEVLEQPVYTKLDRDTGATFPIVPGFKAVSNSKTGSIFAIHNSTYEIIQNTVGWDLAKLLVEDDENVKIETAGVLKDGAICWCLIRIDEPFQVEGDNSDILPYLTISWAHDGSAALRCFPTAIRVVCYNTHEAALGRAESDLRAFTFRHTSNVKARIEDAKKVMSGVRASSAVFRELANELVEVPVTDSQREEFIQTFIPKPTGDIISDRVMDNILEARSKLRGIFDSPTIPEAHRNTAYGMVEASVEYLDHMRAARSSETKFARTLLRAEPLKAKIIPMVRELVSVSR